MFSGEDHLGYVHHFIQSDLSPTMHTVLQDTDLLYIYLVAL